MPLVSRPKPKVLTEITNKHTYKTESVLSSTGIYAVFYEGQPINLRSSNYLGHGPGPKYKKVAFSNPGHATNLCKKLNAQFKTTKFEVVKFTQWEPVLPSQEPK